LRLRLETLRWCAGASGMKKALYGFMGRFMQSMAQCIHRPLLRKVMLIETSIRF
jgi:hypothetical protein